jgi:hypothetical protein
LSAIASGRRVGGASQGASVSSVGCGTTAFLLGVDPGHQDAEALADLLDRVLALAALRGVEDGAVGLVLQDPLAGELADWISWRIFFISARVCSLMIRGPRV